MSQSQTDQLKSLLPKLQALGRTPPSPAELSGLLAQLVAILESLPAGKNPLDALKKPGAWPDKPLTGGTVSNPIYVKAPSLLEFVNVPADVLRSQIETSKTKDASGNIVISITGVTSPLITPANAS